MSPSIFQLVFISISTIGFFTTTTTHSFIYYLIVNILFNLISGRLKVHASCFNESKHSFETVLPYFTCIQEEK